jgi:UMF1 family MFS transporter
MAERFKLTGTERNWVLYDVGNSAFTLMVSTLIPIYFNSLAESEGLSSVDYLSSWSLVLTISTLIVAFSGPVLGAFADQKGHKKPLLILAILIGAVGCAALGFVRQWLVFLAVFLAARVAYQISLVIYDSTLGDVTDCSRADNVSSQGYAWGYIGSVIPFVICLLLVLNAKSLGLKSGTAMMIAFLIVAIWWVLMSCPLLWTYRQIHYVSEGEARGSLIKRLGHTLRDMYRDKKVFLFIIAFFFYIDGVYTIINMSTAYGTTLGLNSTSLLLALLVTQFVAFPSALIMGSLARKIKAETLITICICGYFCIAVFAVFMRTQFHFWILAVGVGLFQGGIQSLSRSYFTKIIPAGKSGQYFGFLDICGKGADALGTLVMGVMTKITGNQRIGVSFIVLFFIAGLVLFRLSAARAAQTE